MRSWVFPGNTSDVTVVKRVRESLRGWKLSRVPFVADSGMNSRDNREELARAAGRYVLACRAGAVADVKYEVLGRAGRYKQITDNLSAKEVVVGDGERRRRYIVCYNASQAERERKHREQVVRDLEEALARHPSRDANAQWAVRLRASGRYGRYLTVTRGGKLRIDRGVVKRAARLDGKWVLVTSDDMLSVADTALAYRGLMVIERCFRTLKRTQICMQPMYHWLPRRIEARVKLCVLALMIARVAELACDQPWPRLRHALETLQATELLTETHRFLHASALVPEARKVLSVLDIKPLKRVLDILPR